MQMQYIGRPVRGSAHAVDEELDFRRLVTDCLETVQALPETFDFSGASEMIGLGDGLGVWVYRAA